MCVCHTCCSPVASAFLQQQTWTSTPLVLSEQTCIRIAHLSPFRPHESHLCRSGFGRKREGDWILHEVSQGGMQLCHILPAPKAFESVGPGVCWQKILEENDPVATETQAAAVHRGCLFFLFTQCLNAPKALVSSLAAVAGQCWKLAQKEAENLSFWQKTSTF